MPAAVFRKKGKKRTICRQNYGVTSLELYVVKGRS